MPDWMTDIRARLAAARLEPARELEIAQELAQHLDDRYAEIRRAGESPDEARRLALDELKDHARMREQLAAVERQLPALPPPGTPGARPLQGLTADIRYAWRRLLATPAFTIFSVLTLALGIGATTAVYSAVYTAALRPPPLRDADRVVNLYHGDPRRSVTSSIWRWALSPPDINDFAAAQTSFSALASWSRFRHALVATGTSEVIIGEMVSGDYFSVVGFGAALGRTLQPADDRPGAPRVIVLGDGLWRRRFGADPAVVGRTVNLGGDLFEIVGVMPREFRGVDLPNLMPTEAWVPLPSTRSQNNDDMHDRERRWLFLKGRLKPGATIAEARAEFRTVGQQLDLAYTSDGERTGRRETRDGWFIMPAADVRMNESMDAMIQPMIVAIMIAVGLVLLVACTNVASLMLARGTARRQEQALRLALGASRWRLVRGQLAEAALVTLGGGLAAYVVARLVMLRLLTATFQLGPGFVVRFEPEFHPTVALVAAASTILALLVFGFIPALLTTRAALREALASGGVGSEGQRWRGRRSLLALQVAVSSGLVAVALLCAQQVLATATRDSGMDLDRIALAQVDFGLLKQDEAHGRRVLESALRQARLQPGIEAVAASSGLPAGVSPPGVSFPDLEVHGTRLVAATPEIFQVLGIPIVAGRGFEDRDGPDAGRVAVVSRRLASELAADGGVLGRPIVTQRRTSINQPEHDRETVTIVGVAEDTDVGMLGRRDEGVIYLPFAQHYEPGMVLVARAASDPAPLPSRLRRILQQVEPDTAVLQAVTGRDLAGHDNNVLKVGAIGAGLLGTLALVLAMAGLYGVMADLVARRTREIGIRMALGADRARMLRMVLLDGIRPVVEGLVLGIGLGVVLRMLFRPLFIRVLPAFDPVLLVVVPAAFLACAVLAAYVPARRAARVDPTIALRAL